jgi:hypothetical protein
VASGKRTRSARGVIVRDWRRWRRSRPFWGGLLLVLAGAEILLIPLASLLIHGGVKLVIYIGIGGVFGILIGALLITAGLLLWISPAHKTFYAVAGLVLGILSFPASNLGGFFLGMLLGIIGGGLAFAWTPDPVEERHPDGRLLAGALLPILLASSLVTGHAAGDPSTSRHPVPSDSVSRAKMIARADEGLEASVSPSVITAGSATLDGLAYQGTVRMPVAGGEQTMMVFTLHSMTLSGNVTATVTENGQSTVTQSSSLAFSDGVTLYATKLSGSLLGIPTTLTPGNVLTLLLHLLNTVTPAIPLTMTNVTTDQPLVIAGSLQAANLSITT